MIHLTHHLLPKLLVTGCIILSSSPTFAQIIPDSTLGSEASQLTPNAIVNGALGDKIEGGARRGGNLFHSFNQFNVNNGQRVYFANPSGVENILTRVTGGQISNILGTLGVDGGANLFLMNPNGIVFGPNASLDISGSFLGTTANAIRFGEKEIFSATIPEAPPLLTINPSALLFTQLNAGKITNQGFLGTRQNLALVGGNVELNGALMVTPGGKIELAAIAGVGSVGLNSNSSLNIPTELPRADVTVFNSKIGVTASSNSGVAIRGRNLDISGNSLIVSQIGASGGARKRGCGKHLCECRSGFIFRPWKSKFQWCIHFC